MLPSNRDDVTCQSIFMQCSKEVSYSAGITSYFTPQTAVILSFSVSLHGVWLCVSFEQFGKPGCINPDVQRQTIEALLASADVPSSRFLRPEFIRLAPPLHTSDDEVCTLHFSN